MLGDQHEEESGRSPLPVYSESHDSYFVGSRKGSTQPTGATGAAQNDLVSVSRITKLVAGGVSNPKIPLALKRDSCEKTQSEKVLQEARADTAPGFFALRVQAVPCYFPVPACYFSVVFDRSAGFMGLSEDFASRPAPIYRDLQVDCTLSLRHKN